MQCHTIEATGGEKEARIVIVLSTIALRGRSVHACQLPRDSA
jgi:hypothetical protein